MEFLTHYDLKELNNLLHDLTGKINEYSHLSDMKLYKTLKNRVDKLKEKTNEEIQRRY